MGRVGETMEWLITVKRDTIVVYDRVFRRVGII